MSVHNDNGARVCVYCGHEVNTGSYTDLVYVRQKNGRVITRYLHGGPCTMAWRAVLGNPDPLRQIHR